MFQLGLPPARIAILTTITGVAFDDAWTNRKVIKIENVEVAVLGLRDLITNKRATARPQDLVDADLLERHR